MKNQGFLTQNLVAIVLSLLIGFVGGVGFAVYQIPSVISQLPTSGQSTTSEEEVARHIKHLEEEVANNQSDPETWTKLAHAYFESDSYEKAIKAYLELIKLSPDNAANFNDLGVMYRRNGHPQDAIDSFRKGIELDSNNVHAQFNIGIVLFHDLNDKEGAIEAWEKVAVLQPNYAVSTGQTIRQLIDTLE